ncbi:bacterio-opsin activator domain-containing protein [Halobacteriaceae archaeon GCM10025711]
MVQDELAEERAEWEAYKPHIVAVLNADPDSAAFERSHEYVRTNSDQVLAESDAVTAEFARVIRDRRAELERVLAVLLAVDVTVAVLGGLFAREYIGRPMAAIARTGRKLAAGETGSADDLDVPVDRSLPEHEQRAEIAQLTTSFEAVQEYHRTASEQARALAARNFDDPVLDATVPGELGAALESMYDDLQVYIHELQTTTEKLDAVIEASPAAILITDPQGRIERSNPAAEEIFGWNSSEVAGELNPAIPDDDREDFRNLLSTVIAGDPVTGIERQRRTASGETIDVSISMATVSGPDGELSGVMSVVEDITERKERERTLRQQRDELQMLNRITDLVLRITQELVESSSRKRVEETACRTLASSNLYETAWIGDVQAGRSEVRIRTTFEDPDDDVTTVTPDGAIGNAVRRAVETGEVQVVQADGGYLGPVPADADSPASPYRDVAAVPLSYRGTTYGVLVATTTREHAFRARERSGLLTLGNTIGFAINAITNKQLLFADTVVDLTFDVTGTSLPLVATTSELDCSLRLDGFVSSSQTDALTLYLEIDGTDAAGFVEAVKQEPEVVDATVIADEADTRRIAVTFGEQSLFSQLAHHEAPVRSVELDGGEGTYVLEAPLAADVEAIVEQLRSVADGVEFAARHEHERRVTTAAEAATAIQDRLTDRQYEVFKTAYFGGYFEWPRDNTIEELAADMGIAGSTFHHHLRHAQRKLASALFGRSNISMANA